MLQDRNHAHTHPKQPRCPRRKRRAEEQGEVDLHFSAAIQHFDTDQTACLVTVVMPNYQNQPSASLSFGMQLMIKATKSFPPAHAGSETLMMQRICQPFCTNIMIGLMRAQSPVWMADKLEARFSFTHQS